MLMREIVKNVSESPEFRQLETVVSEMSEYERFCLSVLLARFAHKALVSHLSDGSRK